MLKRLSIAAAVLAVPFMFSAQAQAQNVALELQLLVDVSGSVVDNEYALQKGGYVAAFQDPTIQAAIAALAPQGGIAVQYVEWSGAGQQSVRVGWTQITDAASANAFATAVNNSTRAFSGLTAPGSAINFATPMFASNSFTGTRLVIDVSGDGSQNDGSSTTAARDAAIAAGITLNGLAILGSEAGLETWYANNIVGGPAGRPGFLVTASSFADFENAVKTKIGREITPTPEPGTLALLGIGLIGLAFGRRRHA